MFEQRKIGKTYLALVRAPKDKFGYPESHKGVVDTPLRFEDGWARLCTDKEKKTGLGQAAETRWEVLGSSVCLSTTSLVHGSADSYEGCCSSNAAQVEARVWSQTPAPCAPRQSYA